jgi:hypothetical protein
VLGFFQRRLALTNRSQGSSQNPVHVGTGLLAHAESFWIPPVDLAHALFPQKIHQSLLVFQVPPQRRDDLLVM